MAKGISFAITADDRPAQGAVDRIARRLAVISASGERFAVGSRELVSGSGLPRLASGIGEVGRRIGGAAESLGRFAPALATLTGAASIAGLARLVQTWTTFGSRLGLDAQRIGTSAQNLHGLQGAATLAGSSAEALTDGMRTLGDNLVDAVGGRSPETVQMLSTLGIGFRDAATGGARLATDVLPEIADKIASIKNPALQARAATALFGGAGEALLPFLRMGAAGIAEYNRQALAYGTMNERGVAASNEMRLAQARLGLAVEGVGYAIAERVAPVLVPLLLRLSDWVSNHREDIARFFEDVAKRLERWIDGGGIDRVTTALTTFGSGISDVVTALGGAGPVVKGFLALWLGSKAIGAIASIGRMVFGLRALAGLVSMSGTLVAGLAYLTARGLMDSGKVVERDAQLRANTALRSRDVMLEGPQDGFDVSGRPIAPPGGRPAGSPPQTYPPGAQGDAAGPRGIRNNNPLNLSFVPGQEGLDPSHPSDGRFGRYTDMEGGVAAAVRQMQRYQDRGLTSVGAMINRWAPPSENDTAGYVRTVSNRMAVQPGAAINLRDPQQAAGLVSAMARVETGRELDPDVVRRGVNRALGLPDTPPGRTGTPLVVASASPAGTVPAPPAPAVAPPPAPLAAGSAGANGTATVRLEHVNPPSGLRTSVQTSGDVQYGGLRIERPALGNTP